MLEVETRIGKRFTIIIPKYLADFLNLTIGDKIISYEGYTFTVAAIYNVTTLFSDILANVLFELPIFTSINTFNIMLNYTTSKIIERIIAIRYRDPLIKDVNQYEEELMSFLTFLQDRLAEKKIALSIITATVVVTASGIILSLIHI